MNEPLTSRLKLFRNLAVACKSGLIRLWFGWPEAEDGDHIEIHKFCDATLRRTLEGLKSYNNDVKYGYVQKELTNDEVEFLKLFEEEIEVRLNYRDQMRRWEMYVNGRPLGPRRERPE
ncbi:hypothetical protein Tco_1185892 [Tanacetum coccineum]